MRRLCVLVFVLLAALPAFVSAADIELVRSPAHDVWRIDFAALAQAQDSAAAGQTAGQDAAPASHAVAVTYSPAYETRRKIHKYASYATLPLFATELWLGQSLYNDPTQAGNKKALHATVGAGIIGLFAVNTVTGVWNMWEARNEPQGRTLHLIHGLLMLAADAGFVETWATAPSTHGQAGLTFGTDEQTHRRIAITSISLATASYVIMLFHNR
jgi:hypothetical protein